MENITHEEMQELREQGVVLDAQKRLAFSTKTVIINLSLTIVILVILLLSK